MTDSTTALLTERGSTHGPWPEQAELAIAIKRTFASGKNWRELEPHQEEALHMIASKISRILSGIPDFYDHWDDIAGYAKLGRGE